MAAAESGCHYGRINHGTVITSSCRTYTGSTRVFCNYHCYSGYKKTSSTVYCVGNETWLPANHLESTPCISDDRIRTTQNPAVPRTTNAPLPPLPSFLPQPTTKHWVQPEITTRKGYYRDPHLEMNVSPAIFVGAVVGGVIALVLIVFAIFFRAHRKNSRECRERSMNFVDANSHNYHDNTNEPQDQTDDSIFRGIVRRIMSNAGQVPNNNQIPTAEQLSPPPYEFVPPRSESQGQEHVRSPPYNQVPSFFDGSPPNQAGHMNQRENMRSDIPDVVIGDLDEPPPYEESIKTDQSSQGDFVDENVKRDSNLPPPPPYSDC